MSNFEALVISKLISMEKELKDVKQGLKELKDELGSRIEKLERQMELQDLSFRALVKASKAAQEVEEELEGTYVREGTGFNTRRTKWVRDPLA